MLCDSCDHASMHMRAAYQAAYITDVIHSFSSNMPIIAGKRVYFGSLPLCYPEILQPHALSHVQHERTSTHTHKHAHACTHTRARARAHTHKQEQFDGIEPQFHRGSCRHCPPRSQGRLHRPAPGTTDSPHLADTLALQAAGHLTGHSAACLACGVGAGCAMGYVGQCDGGRRVGVRRDSLV